MLDAVHPLAGTLRRYSFAYTATHDFDVAREVMVDDYVLYMGDFALRGREDQYIPATERLYRQFPGLGFTVHDLVLGEDRAALLFTEHGWSTLHRGYASWQGISLYTWDGERLTACRVEQDYFGRRDQQEANIPRPIPIPGFDPWLARPADRNEPAEQVATSWLAAGGLATLPEGSLDDEIDAPPARVDLGAEARTTVLDLFSAGDRVVLHGRVDGRYTDGPLRTPSAPEGVDAHLYFAALLRVDGGDVVDARVVTDRLACERRIAGG